MDNLIEHYIFTQYLYEVIVILQALLKTVGKTIETSKFQSYKLFENFHFELSTGKLGSVTRRNHLLRSL